MSTTATNGRKPPPAAPSSRNVERSTLPITTRAALTMLWLAVIDRDYPAVDRALDMLPADPEVRAIAITLCEIGIAIEPRLRCDAARDQALTQLALLDHTFKMLTGRD